MDKIGKKIYFSKETGVPIVVTAEIFTGGVETTTEQDFKEYAALAERVPETVGMIQLEYGQYAQDFAECNGYRVNPETGEIEFSYPDDPNIPGNQEPVYQQPLTTQVTELKQAIADLTMTLAAVLAG